MSTLRAVTLDCAGTLVRVDWQPSRFAVECAAEAGLELEADPARGVYDRLLGSRWGHYRQLNLTRDEAVLDGFWKELTRDWLAELKVAPRWEAPGFAAAWEGLYGSTHRVFSLYDDTVEVLAMLRARGLQVAALSNWDYSLHRVLRLLGIYAAFDTVVASLEEGVEKPDPRLFAIIRERLGVEPEEAWHVGDDPIDDVQGALGAGMRATLLDRGGDELLPTRITRLDRLAEALDWTA